jgi:hypothetical protein
MRSTWGGALADTYRGVLSDGAVRALEAAPDYLCPRIDKAAERDNAPEVLEECRAALDRLRGVAEKLAEEARDARVERDDARDRLADARSAWAAVVAEIDALRQQDRSEAAGICREALDNHEPDWSGATPTEERA